MARQQVFYFSTCKNYNRRKSATGKDISSRCANSQNFLFNISSANFAFLLVKFIM